eukprot:m.14276 g.14276  ORF g.14276 m.14276 type:complete len:116 (-) comp4282_c0_seq1:1364-1711(-)
MIDIKVILCNYLVHAPSFFNEKLDAHCKHNDCVESLPVVYEQMLQFLSLQLHASLVVEEIPWSQVKFSGAHILPYDERVLACACEEGQELKHSPLRRYVLSLQRTQAYPFSSYLH